MLMAVALLPAVMAMPHRRADDTPSLETLWRLHRAAYPDGEAYAIRYRLTRWEVSPMDSSVQTGHCRLIHDAGDSLMGLRFWLEFAEEADDGGLAGYDGQTIYRRFAGQRTVSVYRGTELRAEEILENNSGILLKHAVFRPRSLERVRADGLEVERLSREDLPHAPAIRAWFSDTVQDIHYEQIRWIDRLTGRTLRMELRTRIHGVRQGLTLVVRSVEPIPEPDWEALSAGVEEAPSEVPREAAADPSGPSVGPVAGDPAPPLAFTRADGVEGQLEDLAGQWVLLDFWHLSCFPCLKAMPDLEALQERYGEKGLRILAINAANRPEAIADFMRHNGYGLAWAHCPTEALAPWKVRGYPTYCLVDPEGVVVARGHGLENGIRELLEEALR